MTKETTRKRGRPVEIADGESVTVKLSAATLAQIDAGFDTRAATVRTLVEEALITRSVRAGVGGPSARARIAQAVRDAFQP